MDIKSTAGGVTVKDAEKGTVSCVFATLNVRDSDNDVTLPGAFKEGQRVAISPYGHAVWQGAPPVGTGSIKTVGDEAIFTGSFFMDIPAARDTFLAVKGMGELQQWSYGFQIDDTEHGDFQGRRVKFLKSLTVFEVSPVIRAAGVGTRTTDAKRAEMAELDELQTELTRFEMLAVRAAFQLDAQLETVKSLNPTTFMHYDARGLPIYAGEVAVELLAKRARIDDAVKDMGERVNAYLRKMRA